MMYTAYSRQHPDKTHFLPEILHVAEERFSRRNTIENIYLLADDSEKRSKMSSKY